MKVRKFNPKKFIDEVMLFLDIYNRSLVGTWGFVPMSENEVLAQAAGLKHLLVPDLTSIIEVDGKPIGAGLGLLDYNPIIKRINGKLFPFGFLHLLFRQEEPQTRALDEHQRAARIPTLGLWAAGLEQMLPPAWNVASRMASSVGCWKPITSREPAWSEAAPSGPRATGCTI